MTDRERLHAAPLLDRDLSGTVGTLQALKDAIAFRSGRLDRPCGRCIPGTCAEHAYDERLVAQYQARYATALNEALIFLDRDVIEMVLTPGYRLPLTSTFRTAVLRRLQQIATEGPFVTDLDVLPVVIEYARPG